MSMQAQAVTAVILLLCIPLACSQQAWSLVEECNSSISSSAPLPAGMSPCRVYGAMRGGEQQVWWVVVGTEPTPYDLVVELRTLRGAADLAVTTPTGRTVTDLAAITQPLRAPNGLVHVVLHRGDTVAGMGASPTPKNITITISATSETATYSLVVHTPATDSLLAREEVTAMRGLMGRCCDFNDNEVGRSCRLLQTALASNRTWDQDLCQMPPNECDADGRLVRLVLPGSDKGNLLCDSFPTELSALSRLRELDLSANYLIGSLEQAASVLSNSSLTALSALYLTSNLLEGTFPCTLLEGLPALRVLWVGWNSLWGRLDLAACTTHAGRGGNLVELALPGNLFSGVVPALPEGSPMRLLDLHGSGNIITAGFTGVLPARLTSAQQLVMLDLSDNNITGTLPWVGSGGGLPPNLKVFCISSNRLRGSLPSLSASTPANHPLKTLWASSNDFSGTIPSTLWQPSELLHMDLDSNELTGALPATAPFPTATATLHQLDLALNKLTGTLSPWLGELNGLATLNLGGNSGLGGSLEAFGASLSFSNTLRQFNCSGCALTGHVHDRLALLSLFTHGSTAEPGWARYRGRPTVLDVSDNLLTGHLPGWVFTALRTLTDDDLRVMRVAVGPQRGGRPLTCPPPPARAPGAPAPKADALTVRLEFLYNLKCRHEVLGDVYYSDSLAYVDPNAPSSPSPATSPTPATPREASGGGGSSGVSGGTLIGVAVGCAMVGLLVALVVLFVYFKNKPPPAPQTGTEHQFYNNPLAMDQARGLQPSEAATMNIRLPEKESPWYQRFGRAFVPRRLMNAGPDGGSPDVGASGQAPQWTPNLLNLPENTDLTEAFVEDDNHMPPPPTGPLSPGGASSPYLAHHYDIGGGSL